MSAPVTAARIVPPSDRRADNDHDRHITWHAEEARPWATMRRAERLARDLTAERDTSKRLADKVLDLGRELEALRDAVRAHEASTRALYRAGRPISVADERLWGAARK